MNCQKAKTIQITKYLSSLGFKPDRIVTKNYWYKSMIRQNESQASFKVDIQQNCWYDHGLGEGGNILDLVMKMHGLNKVSEALKKLESNHVPPTFSFHQQKVKNPAKTTYRIQQIDRLSNRALVEYISNVRGINIELVRKYCSEVYYQLNQKNYFAIGFQNEQGGWELRNKYWKGCIGSKGITTLVNGYKNCCVFEGFIDFLSFLQLFPGKAKDKDFLILNSLSNAKVSLSKIGHYERLNLFLDNDQAGQKTTRELVNTAPNIIDQSHLFMPHKDLNEFLKNQCYQEGYC
jgi:hypothetical protein